MEKLLTSCLLAIVFLSHKAYAVPYDYRFNHKCLAKPEEAHYGGGIVVNPELKFGLKGWTIFGDAKVKHQKSKDGNKYIVAYNRSTTFDSFAQRFNLEEDKLYVFSAWLRVSQGNAHIAAKFKTRTGDETAGWAIARKGCWSMLKGGLVVNSSGPALLYFETEDTSVHIMADSISLQPFTHEEWKSHQDQRIEKVRKNKVKFQAVDQHGQPLANATITIKQTLQGFPVGCTMNPLILDNTAYRHWFTPRFRYTVFENELKWYINEPSRGKEDYGAADAMLKFAQANNIQVRGHNIFWDNPKLQPNWVGGLSTDVLRIVTDHRINYVMRRYIGQMIHWDVVNENLHYSFFEEKFGANASTTFFEKVNQIDGNTIPFLNDFNTIEDGEGLASPAKYLAKISQIRREGYTGPLGIGLEGHFTVPNLPYIRASLDQLSSTNLPIWLTEMDVDSRPDQARYLEQILREVHAHAGVQGIMIWGAWTPTGCYRMCLTDNNFKNLATGDVVDKLLSEWGLATRLKGTTDSSGHFETSLFHGEYQARVRHPSLLRSTNNLIKRFSVESMPQVDQRKIHVKLHAGVNINNKRN